MRIRILPTVLSIYREEASKLGSAYDAGASQTGPLFLLVVGPSCSPHGRRATLASGSNPPNTQPWLARRRRSPSSPSQSAVGMVIASNSRHLNPRNSADQTRRLNCRPPAFWPSERRRTKAWPSSRAVVAATFSEDFDEVALRLRGGNHSGLAEQVQATLRRLGRAESANRSIRNCQPSSKSTGPSPFSKIKETFPTPSHSTSKSEAPHSIMLSKFSTRRSTPANSGLRRRSETCRSMRQSCILVVALGAVLICASHRRRDVSTASGIPMKVDDLCCDSWPLA